jgi:hypothetical protein
MKKMGTIICQTRSDNIHSAVAYKKCHHCAEFEIHATIFMLVSCLAYSSTVQDVFLQNVN